MSRFTPIRRKAIAGLVGCSLVMLSACGSDDVKSEPSTPGSATPTEVSSSPTTPGSVPAQDGPFAVTDPNGEVVLPAKPVRIISLSPTHTEMLYAIGAGDQVIAVDEYSNFPAEVSAVPNDLSGFTPNVEAIAEYKPDLVVIGDDSAKLSEQLGQVDIPVWFGPSAVSLDDVYAQIEQLGVLTGHVAESVALVAKMTADVKAILADVPELSSPLRYYHEVDSTYFSTTSNSFIGAIYALAGLQNIADTAEAGNDYPQLSAEFIVSANPDLIFLADTKYSQQTAETVAARDGWAAIAAVKNGHVIAMDDDLASRWGPRVVDYLRAVVAAVTAASSVPAG